MNRTKYLLYAFVGLLTLAACRSDHRYSTVPPEPIAVNATADVRGFSVKMAAAIVSDPKNGNHEQIEQMLNDPNNGIYNLDLDHDGNVDPIGFNESKDANGNLVLTFYAHLTSGDQEIGHCNITYNQDSAQLIVNAGYNTMLFGPSSTYVVYHPYYYSPYYPTYGSWYLGSMWHSTRSLGWSRPVYVPAYRSSYYVPHTVRSYETVKTIRKESTVNKTTVAPKVSSRPVAKAPAASPSLGGMAGKQKDFKANSGPSTPRQTAPTFGPKPSAPAAPTRSYTPTPRPSAPAPRPSPSFGSRPSSGFGGGSRPSPSFGGSRSSPSGGRR
jgi:hypothetical protein